MSSIVLNSAQGRIVLRLRPEVAPVTCAHVTRLIAAGLLDNSTFYRSDFVIQFGLHGTKISSPFPPLNVNESQAPGHLSNTRGAVAVAHWDVPDCGNTEFFISLKENSHLDTAYGGYCVFAVVNADDAESWKTVDLVAAAVARGDKIKVEKVSIL